RVGQRHLDARQLEAQVDQVVDLLLRILQLAQVQLAVDLAQVLVPAVDARTDLPAVQRADDLDQRDEQHQQRNGQDDVAVGQRGDAKRQVALQDRQSLAVEVLGLVQRGEVAGGRRRELAGGVQQVAFLE